MAVTRAGLLTLSVLALAACAKPPGSNAPPALEAPVRHVVVAPLDLAIDTPEALDGQDELVWQELLRHLQARADRVSVLSASSAERLWLEATLDLDPSDRSRALEVARSRFAEALAEHRAYDVLVVPTLVVRPARMHGMYASWDGVRRAVPGGSDMIDPGLANTLSQAGAVEVMGLRGKVAAASLHVAAVRSDGAPVYEGIGGLDLIQQVDRDRQTGRWVFQLRPAPFGDAEHLREGVERALQAAHWEVDPGSDTDAAQSIARARREIDR